MKKKTIISIICLLLNGCYFNQNLSSLNNYSNSENNISTISPNIYSNLSSLSSNMESDINNSSIISSDPYFGISYEEFYNNYKEATSYEDAMYRTKHGFISGSITPSSHETINNTMYADNDFLRFSNAYYEYDDNNNPIAYHINTKEDIYKIIYYNAGYVSLEEVAAYILAFGEVPPNSNYDKGKNGKQNSIIEWGEYGRVNIGKYSNNVSKYPYEPELPTSDSKGKSYSYTETDFGIMVPFTLSNGEYIGIYNDGSSIARGVCRIVFTSSYSDGTKIDDINERHVFYTYNHYNDFEEYLNYYGGWGSRFGNETNGNQLNSGSNPSPYIKAIIVDKNTI